MTWHGMTCQKKPEYIKTKLWLFHQTMWWLMFNTLLELSSGPHFVSHWPIQSFTLGEVLKMSLDPATHTMTPDCRSMSIFEMERFCTKISLVCLQCCICHQLKIKIKRWYSWLPMNSNQSYWLKRSKMCGIISKRISPTHAHIQPIQIRPTDNTLE